MNQEFNPFSITGYLVMNSSKLPESFEEVFANAVYEHVKGHANDGLSLFVFATPSPSGGTMHIYPISAKDALTAFHIAEFLHESRGLPRSYEWSLVFWYGDINECNPVNE